MSWLTDFKRDADRFLGRERPVRGARLAAKIIAQPGLVFALLMRVQIALDDRGLFLPARLVHLLNLAIETLRISRRGLQRRNRLDPNGRDETRYLRPLEEIVARGITPAEAMMAKVQESWNGSVDPVYNEYAY